MNRKAKAKQLVKVEKVKDLHFDHPYNDPLEWLKGGFEKSPWPDDKMQEFQRRLDSAFGAPNALVLVWSGDRSYGDVFLDEHGDVERKPVLLFAEQQINDKDYLYITCPRFLIMEVLHGSQLEDGWEEASVVPDKDGILRRIRPRKPPQYMYKHLRIIAEHEQTMMLGDIPPCCVRMLNQNRICFGKYREPAESDVAFVKAIRDDHDHRGIAQRNDQPTTAKVLEQSSLAARHFIKRAQEQQALGVKEMMLANSEVFFGDLLARTGSTKSFKELEIIAKGAMEAQEDQRFGQQ